MIQAELSRPSFDQLVASLSSKLNAAVATFAPADALAMWRRVRELGKGLAAGVRLRVKLAESPASGMSSDNPSTLLIARETISTEAGLRPSASAFSRITPLSGVERTSTRLMPHSTGRLFARM